MKKTMKKYISAILGAVSALCMIFGGVLTVKDSEIVTPSAEMVENTEWIAPYHQLTAYENTETGFTHLTISNYGERMYYNKKLTLDGLTVTIGSTNMVAQSRFGFGFTKEASSYTPETGPFNVTVVPSQVPSWNQDCLYINSTHADGTIVYTPTSYPTHGVCNVDGNLQNRFPTAVNSSAQYSITFKYMGEITGIGEYWQATITLDVGNPFRAGLTEIQVLFLQSSLDGALDENGQIYLSVWGMSSAGEFYIKATEKTEAQKLVEKYAEVRGNSSADAATVAAARQEAVDAIAALSTDEQTQYLGQLAAIDVEYYDSIRKNSSADAATVTAAREAAVNAIAALPTAEQTQYLGQLAEIDIAYYEYVKTNASENVEAVWAARQTAVTAVEALPETEQATYSAMLSEKDSADHRWVAREADGIITAAPGYDITTGHSVLAPKDWGQGYTYAEKVTLDGLTVILGSDDHLTQSRIGFGLVSTLGGYPLCKEEDGVLNGTVNFMLIPQYAQNLDGFFVIDSHDETPYPDDMKTGVKEDEILYTILYADEDCKENYLCVRDGKQISWLPSVASKRTAYSVTFNKCTNNNYQVTIHLLNGQAYGSNEDVVAYLPKEQLEGVVDVNGQCYVAAWGWPKTEGGLIYPFYADVMDSEYAKKYTATLSAQEKYEEAIRTGVGDADLDSMKQTLTDSISGLNCYHYLGAQHQAEELDSLRKTMAGFKQDASLTLQESLTLNYKLTIPDELFAEFGGITVKVSVDDESYTYDVSNFIDRADGTWSCPIVNFGPQWMTENISLEMKATKLNGDLLFQRSISGYTVKAYCDTLLAAEGASTEMKNAVVDLLNYGAAAQKYANRNTDKLANDGVTYTSTTQANPANATDVLAVNQGTEVKFTAITAHLQDQVTAYAKFKYDGDASLLTANMIVGGVGTAGIPITSLGNGYYCVESTALSPLQFDDEILFYIFVNNDTGASCRFSVNSYIKRNYGHEKAGELITALYKYSVGVSNYANILPANILLDTTFSNGLKTSTGILSTGNDNATPSWMVQEWYSRNSLAKEANTAFVYPYADASKKLEINKNTDSIYMEINGSAEYEQDRVSGEWPHLLLQQDYYNDELVRLADQSSLCMQMNYTITKCEDKSYGEANPSIHGAQFVWYITLQNRTEGHAEYGHYMWFGILLFDNRNVGKPIEASLAADTGKSDATGMWIYQPATSEWAPGGVSPDVNQTVSLNLDIMDLAYDAFTAAQDQGSFATTTWEDLYIGSTNFGFEIPGTYDIGVQISNLGLIYTPKANA